MFQIELLEENLVTSGMLLVQSYSGCVFPVTPSTLPDSTLVRISSIRLGVRYPIIFHGCAPHWPNPWSQGHFFYQSVGAVVENENLGVFSECTHPAQAHWI